ncbi:hypothetical protein ACHAWF_017374 [Thalassiosira exigua]
MQARFKNCDARSFNQGLGLSMTLIQGSGFPPSQSSALRLPKPASLPSAPLIPPSPSVTALSTGDRRTDNCELDRYDPIRYNPHHPTATMPTTSKEKADGIFAGCEDLLNDFGVPEAHRASKKRSPGNPRFVSIPDVSSPGMSPLEGGGIGVGGSAPSTPSAAVEGGESDLARSQRAWGRAIDRYVASVLDDADADGDAEGGGDRGGTKRGAPSSSAVASAFAMAGLPSPGGRSLRSFGSGRRSERSGAKGESSKKSSKGREEKSKRRSEHPDNHLLAALQALEDTNRTPSSPASPRRHVDLDGRIEDDVSFAPVNPFGEFDGLHNTGMSNEKEPNSRMERIKSYLREERRPISLIVLAVLVVSIVSVSTRVVNGKGGASGDDPGNPDLALDVPTEVLALAGLAPPPTTSPSPPSLQGSVSFEDDTEPPTGFPTYLPTENPVATDEPTETPTERPTEEPSDRPSPRPTKRVTEFPTPGATAEPTPEPTNKPTTFHPTSFPTARPTSSPTVPPTAPPTFLPTASPVMPAKYYEMLRAVQYVSGGPSPFEDPTTSQSRAFDWIYFDGQPSTNVYEFFEQYATATVFFALTRARTKWSGDEVPPVLPRSGTNATNGTVEDLASFADRPEVCGWDGVRCAFNYTTETVHVTEITLANRGLRGTIPEEIGFLPYLNRIDLSGNELTGTVPEAVYGLSRLRHLFLNDNNLSGTISPSIDNLHLAEDIFLGQNSFTGILPTTIGSARPNNWRFFSVHDNAIGGPIPEGMRLRRAYMLDFSRNRFFGTIPSDMSMDNFSTLRLLYLDHNQLTGTMPSSLMEMRKMKAIILNDNLLEGTIPNVEDDDLKKNLLTLRFQNNGFTFLPSDICDLDVDRGYYELVELGVDCAICPLDCDICQDRCY